MNKYRAKKTEIDGIVFDSKREAARYQDLKLLERVGAIRDLKLQPKYPLKVEGKLIATYVADFTYFDAQMLRPVVEDAKGFKTPVYRLKKKLFLVLYGASCEFRET